MTDFGGKTSIFSHPVYLFLRKFSLQDSRGGSVTAFPCATILSTQAEKLISMMRRTAAHLRNPEQQDDEFLVRHIYDNYCIVREKGVNVPVLKNFVQICIQLW
nr:nucleotidyl transferase AbiEii/AbiGii toxin family protein [Escherichia coli]